MKKELRIVRDRTSDNYPWVVMDERSRWLKVCRTYHEAKDFISDRPPAATDCGDGKPL